MMRCPTDRNAAWDHWRRRVNGEALPINPDRIECGFYRARRGSRYVAVQIDLNAPVDPDTGELIADEDFVAFIGRDVFYAPDYVHEIWLRCAGSPISEAEFERLSRMPEVSDLTRAVIT